MARLGETFDATTVEPNKPLEALPPGRYVVQIVNSEMRPTKDGMGQLLWLELDVLEGEYAGRKLFDRLNLINNNPTTVEIAQRTLSAICHAVGKMQVDDSEQLHLIPLIADVKVQPPKNGYDAQNTLRYMPLERQPAPRPVAPAARPAAAARPASAGGFSGARGKDRHRSLASQQLIDGERYGIRPVDLPATREACRERLAELAAEVAAIKTRIAAADLERQRRRGRVDPRQFQEWRTALRDKQSEIERLTRHMATLPSRRDAFKDRLIAVLRADYDDIAWQAALERARRLREA